MIDKITLSEGLMDPNRNHEKKFKFKSLSEMCNRIEKVTITITITIIF